MFAFEPVLSAAERRGTPGDGFLYQESADGRVSNQSKTIVRLRWESKNCLITKKTSLVHNATEAMTMVLPWSVLIAKLKHYASAGNRTRAARVAGEHSTTEPPMLTFDTDFLLVLIYSIMLNA